MSDKEKITVLNGIEKQYIDENMDEMLKSIGSNIKFSDNVWRCDKLKDYDGIECKERIHFKDIDVEYLDLVKYYVIATDDKLNTIKLKLQFIKVFLKYLCEYEKKVPLKSVNRSTIDRYRNYTNSLEVIKATKAKRLQVVADFFWKLSGWEGIPQNNPVNKRVHVIRVSRNDNKIKTKYIPDRILGKIDKIFISEDIPVHYRLYYWLCRLYPSRGCELSSLKLDCIKPLNNKYVYFKPEGKSVNAFSQKKIIDIYMSYQGIEKYLIDCYYQQRNVSLRLQEKAIEDFWGLLFLYNPNSRGRKGVTQKRITLLDGDKFNKYLKKICKEYEVFNVGDEKLSVTVHSFRHNAITDRLYENFNVTSIKDMSGQMSNSTVIDSYFHSKEDKRKKLQEKILKEKFKAGRNRKYEIIGDKETKIDNSSNEDNVPKSKLIFRGRIMNLDKNREERLLLNKRSYKISYSDKCIGLCTEIASCTSGIFNCLGCDEFAADSNEIMFFRDQVLYWKEKEENLKLKGSKFQLKHATETKKLFEQIVNRIEIVEKNN